LPSMDLASIEDQVVFVRHSIDFDDAELKMFELHSSPHQGKTSRTLQNLVEPRGTQWNLAEPGGTSRNLVNLVEPGGTSWNLYSCTLRPDDRVRNDMPNRLTDLGYSECVLCACGRIGPNIERPAEVAAV